MKKLLQFKSCLLIALFILLLAAGNEANGQRIASATGNWSNIATWGGQPVPTNMDDITINSGVTVTMDVNGTCQSIADMAGGEISGTGILTIAGNSGVAIAEITGTAIISCQVDMPGSASVTVTGDLTITGAIGGAATDFTKSGSGRLIIAGANSYTGATIISDGIVNIQNSSAFGGGGSVTVKTGASLELEGAMLMLTNSLILSGTGSGTVAGALNNKSGLNFWLGPILIDGGTTNIEGAGGSLMLLGSTDLQGNQLNINCDASAYILIDGTISSSTTPGSITKDGLGELSLSFQDATLNNLTINNGIFKSTAGSLNLSGNFTNSGSFNHNSGSVMLNGSVAQSIGGTQPTIFYNLTLANSGGAMLGASESIEGLLTLTDGNLVLGSNDLTLGSSSVAGPLSVSNMILADGGGECRRNFTTTGSYLFPIGNGMGTPEYSPISLDFTSGTFSPSAFAAVRVTDATHPDNTSPVDFLSRYWSVSDSGISSYVCNLTASFAASDINGSTSNMVTGEWIGSAPWQNFDVVSASTISATGVTGFGDFTGITPTTVNPDNTILLTSASGTDNQIICVNTAISDILYSTTGATGATFNGLPSGISGSWFGNVVTISGIPSVSGIFPYTISLTGGYGIISVTGSITITTNIPTITLSSAAGTDSQDICINQAVLNISYATTDASGATFSGLPAGVNGIWAGNVVTISGTPSASGIFSYTITLTGGCGTVTKTGTIAVTPDNTISLTSAVGTDSQNICINSSITDITYATTGATGATFSGLPAGVNGIWAGNVVTISGTPSASGTFSYTITLTGGCGTVTKTGTIAVTPDNSISLTSAVGTDSQNICINSSITDITYATTDTTGATISGLPAGVNGIWAGNVITINGTPSASGTFSYTITLTGGCGTVTKTGTITVTPDNTISLTSAVGTDSQNICINTSITDITYATTDTTGATISGLPAGVNGIWAGNVITINGTPSASGIFNYTITLTGGCGTVTKTGTITVTPDNSISLTSAVGTDSQNICINSSITDITYATTGATGATFSGLPAGVSGIWAGNVVTISGAPSASGTFSYTITLTGGCGTVTKTGTITVTPDNTISLTSAVGTDSQNICINTSITDITYSTTGATGATFSGLPTGVSGNWSGDVVTISGTPSASGIFSYTITLTGGCGTVTKTGTITVTPDNSISLTSAVGTDSQNICINSSITDITYATTGATGATFSGLPAGVSGIWAGNVVTISGAPSASGTFSYTITLTGGCGTVTKTGTITVTPDNTISLTSAVGTDSQNICINSSITDITYATTGAIGATFSGLPAGVNGIWAGNVVTISGTPSASGIFSYTITLTGGCGTVTKTGTIAVTPENTISLTSAVGTDSQNICINTSITDITYATTYTTGATFSGLPAGVNGIWAGNVVTISGTPTASGIFNYTITLTGGCGTVTKIGTITVTPDNSISLTSAVGTDSQNICINTSITDITYSTTGATGATFSGLPTGVSGNWSGDVVTISGTPSASGIFSYTITLTGGCGTVTKTGTIAVTPDNTISLTSAVGTDSQNICINSSITDITYATTGAFGATFSGLPAGVNGIWAGNVVTISGTPTASGIFNYTITLTGGCGTVTKTGTLTVTPKNTIALTSAAGTDNQTKCINTAITDVTYATTGATGATFSGLPADVNGVWAGNVVTISGTPSASGIFIYTITLTGGCGTVTKTGTLTVTPDNTIALTSAAGTDNQTKCINTAITNITYSTTGATGATFSGLPAGVSGIWAGNVITINGTPSASGTFSYTITLTGGCGTVTKTGTLTVTPDNTIALTSAAGTDNQTKCINTAITNITYSTTGATGATFSGLPAGVSGIWAGNVVTISGAPSASGTFNCTITLTGGCGTVTKTGTLTVTPDNTISLSSAAGTDNQTKCINTAITNITYTITGATGAIFSGLPAGISGIWAGNVVTISGAPSASGTFNYTITLTGGCGTVTKTGTLTVTPDNTIALTSAAGTDNQTKCINTAITNITYSTTGATVATFSGLPAGVSGIWAGNVITINGTPSASGTFSYTITLTGGCGTVTKTGTLTVTPDNTIALTSAAGTDNQTKCINTAITNITYSTTGATGATFSGLPAGVSGIWAGNLVTISGTPTASGIFNYTITLTGGCGTVTKTGTITVTPDNTIILSSLPGTENQIKCINTAIVNITYTTTGATGATFGGLPSGVNGIWAGNVVTISGTPSASGIFSYTITLTGGCSTVTKSGTITVTSDNTILLSSLPGTDNQAKCINTAITNITYATTGATGATISGLPAGINGSWFGNVVTINGTPSASGVFSYTITLAGGCGTVTKTGTLTIAPNNTIALTSAAGTDNQTKCINTTITDVTYSTTGATGATFSGLPAGVSGIWAGNVVTISGAPSASGTFNYTITLTGGCGTVTKTGTLTVTPDNTIALTSAAGTDNQTKCINTAITNITYSTTGATGATFSGLPAGVSGIWAGNVVTISGAPSASGTFNYTITLTGGCGTVTKTGTLTVTPDNTIALTSAAGTDNQTKCINTAITNITYSTTGATVATFSGLPAGVSGIWAGNVVTISGTPTASGTFNYTITLTGGCGTVTKTGTLTITPNNTIALTSAAGTDNQTKCINTAIVNITYTTTGATGATFGGLPSGVNGIWAGNVVTISGTPSASGIFSYTITLTGGCSTVTKSGTITVTSDNTILLSSLPGTDNQAKCINTAITNITYATTGATGATISGLPAGINGSWFGNVVTINGTPSASGVFSYTITLAGGCGTVTKTGTLTIAPNNTIALTSAAGTDNQTKCINTTITDVTYSTTGATGATFSGLPAGVSGIWAGNVVTISGTPTASGIFNYTITLTGGCGTVTKTGTITVTPDNTIILSSLPGTENQIKCINTAITNITYFTTGATGATYSGLPTGVSGSWASSTLMINGTPTVSGVFNYTINLTGGCGTETKTGTITVTPDNTIVLSSLPGTDNQTKCINTAIVNITYTTTGATGATFGGLPSGVNGIWAGNAIVISGTPSVSGIFNYSVTLTGGCGIITKTGSLTVTPANTINLSSAVGTDNQTKCINTAITNITYSTTGATGATFSGLPTGVNGSLVGNLITISGTSSVSGLFNYSITLTGGCGSVSKSGTLTISPDNTIVLSSAAGTDGQTKCINTAIFNITYLTTGATGAIFSGLPAGVSGSRSGNLLTISGTPSVSGTFIYTITLTGGCGIVTKTGTITVSPNNTIALSSAAGTDNQTTCINTAFANITYTTTGATGATFSGFPAGVSGSWAGNAVSITGTPSESGLFNYIITLTGGCGIVTKTGAFAVSPDNTIALTSAAGTDGQTKCISTPIQNITYVTTGATGATFTGLPAGVIGSQSGNVLTINGIPSVSGAFNYTIALTGGCGIVTKTGSVTVTPNNTILLSSAIGTDNQTKCINTAIANITYTTTGATGATFSGLPAGISGIWAGNAVSISGTPSVSGIFNYTITLTGGCGIVTKTATITVTPNNTIVLSSVAGSDNQTKCINTAIVNITYTTTGATGATFSGFPPGISGSWAGNVVTIGGTPSASGVFNYIITLSGGCGTITKTGTLTVTPDNTIALASAVGTDGQTICINTPVTNITYTATGATGATFSGLPAGINGNLAGNLVTISGTPTVSGTFNYTVTLTGGCGTITKSGVITIIPDNTIILSSAVGTDAQTQCINTAIANITYATTGASGATFSGFPAGVSGSWVGNVVTISGTPSVAGTFNYTITLTGGCGVITKNGTITVPKMNKIVLSSANGTNNQVRCINTPITTIIYSTTGAAGATFTGLPAGVSGNWVADEVNISGIPTATGIYNFTITLTGGCGIATKTGSITVLPDNTITLSSAAGTDAQTICINTAITNITYITTNATGAIFSGLPSGISGTWSSNTVTISGTLTSSGSYTYLITLTGGCGAITKTGTITVTPDNIITLSSAAGTDNQTKCLNIPIANITYTTTGATGATFSGLPVGVTGSWSGNTVTISGTPSLPGSFLYTITLTGGCGTVTKTGTITVNQIPVATATPSLQSICLGGATSITLGSSIIGTTFGWTAAVTPAGSITGASGGAGSIISQSLVNSTISQASVTYSVTPMAYSCSGSAIDVNVTINPMPVLTSTTSTSICSNTTFAYIPASNVLSTSFTWTRASVVGIQNLAASGTGNINEILINTTNSAKTVVYVYSLTANGCLSIQNLTVIVSPQPVLTSTTSPAAVCSENSFDYTPLSSVPGTTFAWTRAAVAGISSAVGAGTGNVSETLINTTNGSVVVPYIYILTANGCTSQVTVNATIKPRPVLSGTLTPGAICTNTVFSYTPASIVAGATFSWSRSPVAGISNTVGFGTGNPNETLDNISSVPVPVIYIYTLQANGCSYAQNVTVTVNPDPLINNPGNQEFCSGATTPVVSITGPISGSNFTWTNNNASIGLAANGTGDIPSFVATNSTSLPVVATVIITPTANGCSGTLLPFTISINPTATANTPANQVICSGANSGAITFAGTFSSITWVNNHPEIGLAASGTGNISSFTTSNIGLSPIIATVTATPHFSASGSGCDGTPVNFTLTIYPASVGGSIAGSAVVCSGSNNTTLTLSGNTGTILKWQYSTDNWISASDIANLTTTQIATNLTATTKYRAVIQSGVCASVNSANGVISVDPVSIGGTVTGGTTICAGSTSGTLTLNGSTGTILKWQSSVSPFSIWSDIANTAFSYTSAALAQTTQFRAVVQSGLCGATSSSATTVTVDPTTISGSVTGGTTICTGSTSSLLTLSGQTGAIVKWQYSLPPFITWNDIVNVSGTYTSGALTQTTQFRAIVQSGSCAAGNSATTTVLVNAATVPGSVAGGTPICSGSTSGLLTLSGYTGTIIRWESSVSPFSVWTTIANTASTYTSGALAQTTQFRAVVQSGVCAAANSTTTTVTVSPVSVGGSISGSSTICSGNTSGLLSLSGQTGTIIKWQSSISPFSVWTDIVNTSTTYTSGILTQTTQYRAVVQSGVCAVANSGVATISVNPIPTLSSTLTPSGICSNTIFNYPHAFSVPGTTYTWTRPVIAGISNGTASSNTNVPDEILFNTTTNPIEVTYNYALSAGGCTNNQQVKVWVTQTPLLTSTLSPPDICSGANFTYIPTSDISGTVFSWSRPAVGSNPANSGIGNPNEVLINNTTNPIGVTYTYYLSSSQCANPIPYNVIFALIGSPVVTASASKNTICPGEIINLFSTVSNISTPPSTLIIDENFNAAPVGWTTTNTSTGGTPANSAWTLRPNNYVYNPGTAVTFQSNDNSQFYLTNSQAQGGSPTNTSLVSPPMSTMGYTALSLDFWQYYLDKAANSGDYAYVDVSTNGTAWTNIATYNSTQGGATAFSHPVISLTGYINNPVFYIRFRYIATNDKYWAIDNVKITGTQSAISTVAWTSSPAGFSSVATNPINVAPAATTTYTATYTDQNNGCSRSASTTVTVRTPPAPVITADYCSLRPKVQLSVSGSYSSYLWNTGATSSTLLVDIAGNYMVTVTDAFGCTGTASIQVATELVTNGNFSAGNTGFTTDYGYRADIGGNTELVPEGLYGVGTNGQNYHSNFWGYDHTTNNGTGNFMIVNGWGSTYVVWQETNVVVTPNTDYYFAACAISLNNVGPYAKLRFEINGLQVGSTANLTAGTNSNANPWKAGDRFYGAWNSGAATLATIRIINLEPALGGNDFGLDDISFGSLANVPFSAAVSSNSPAATPICSRNTLQLSSAVTGGKPPIVYSWTGPNGFTSSAANPSISNIPSTGGGKYILSVKDWYNCPGVKDSTIVVLNTTPEIPNQSTTICSGSVFTISPVTGGATVVPAGTNYTWSSPTGTGFTGGSAQAVGQPSISQTLTNTTTSPVTAVYTVTPATPTCTGSSFTVTVTINPIAIANAGPAQAVCSVSPAVTLAGSIGGAATNAVWSGETGTYNPNNTSLTAVYTPSAAEITAGTVTLVLTTNDPDGAGPCSAATSPVTITIRSTPVLSTVVTQVKCYGASTGAIVLTVTGGGATPTFVWKRSNGTQVATTKDISGLVADTYTVTVTGTAPSTCSSSISVTITQPSSALQAVASPTGTLCAGSATGTINLAVSGGTAGYTYAWTASGGGVVPPAQVNSQNQTGLLSGTYSVVITDINSCTVNTSANVNLAINTAPIIITSPVTRNFTGCNTGIITTPAFSSLLANSTYAVFSDVNNLGVATDNCGITTLQYQDVATVSCPIIVTRTWTLGDASGLTTTCQQTITVKDIVAPVWITIAGNLNRTIECSDAAGLSVAMNLFPVATDACDADVSNIVKTAAAFVASPGCSQSGSYTNTWKVTDECNNTSAAYTQVITIADNTAPTWTTMAGSLDRTLDCSDAAGMIAAQLLKPVAADLCDGNVTNIIKVSGGFVPGGICSSQGKYTNTWTVKDDCGNTSAVFSQHITIIDNSAPVWLTAPAALNRSIVCSDIAGLAAAQSLYPAAWDNCDVNVTNLVKISGVFVPAGACILEGSYTNTWTVMDDCGNISALFTQVITIVNNADPTVICPVSNAYSCDSPSLQPSVTGSATMWSGCASNPVLTWSDAITTGSCAGNYTITRTWKATNICGNNATCDQTIFVQDAKPPVIACPVSGNQNKYPNPAAPYIHPDNSWDAIATDGCSGAALTVSLSGATISGPHTSLNGVSFSEGVTTVTWTATDGCGISSYCSFTVTVAFQPQISCPASINRNNSPNVCGATLNPGFPAWLSGTTPFSYSWIMTGATTASGTGPIGTYMFNGGITNITWTATNVAGTSICTQTITIMDNQAPVFAAPADRVYCVNDIITADYFDPTMDIAPARPDYYLFAAGNTDFNLNPATFTDNCATSCAFGIRWRIDFQDGTSLPALAGTYITGQPSAYGTDIMLPGAATSGVVHHITYLVVDCSGNVSAPKSVIISINPRADVIKLY